MWVNFLENGEVRLSQGRVSKGGTESAISILKEKRPGYESQPFFKPIRKSLVVRRSAS